MNSLTAVFRASFGASRALCVASLTTSLITFALSPAVAQESDSGRRAAEGRSREKTDEGKPEKKIFSGPQAGEKLGEFPVWIVPSDDSDSTKVDLREVASKTPLTAVVMHGKSRPAFMIWRALHAYGVKLGDEKMPVYCVMLSDDRSSEDQWMRGIQKRLFPKGGHFAIADGGLEGPGAIGLNRTASMTILVVKDGKVTDNFAFTQVTAQVDAPKVLAAMAKAAGEKEAPALKDLLPQANQMQRARPNARANSGNRGGGSR